MNSLEAVVKGYFQDTAGWAARLSDSTFVQSTAYAHVRALLQYWHAFMACIPVADVALPLNQSKSWQQIPG